MKYITGVFALNILDTDTGTPGDWHASCLDWDHPQILDTNESIFETWGVYKNERCPTDITNNIVANNLRACADLVEHGCFEPVRGMRRDYIDDESYTEEFLSHIWELRNRPNWNAIDQFMGEEYTMSWLNWKSEHETD